MGRGGVRRIVGAGVSGRWVPGRTAWLVASVLLVPVMGAANAQAVAATVSEASPVTADTRDLSPEAVASRKAADSGSPVEVGAETTPTQLVTAQPDGTFTVAFDPVPVRVKKASGWVPVDTDLEATSSGVVVPKAAAADIAFSGGGSRDPLATITQDGKTYSVGSPWALPSPKLSGSTATYPDVMSGTDLVVQATADGFSENLVVKSATRLRTRICRASLSLSPPMASPRTTRIPAAPPWWMIKGARCSPRVPP